MSYKFNIADRRYINYQELGRNYVVSSSNWCQLNESSASLDSVRMELGHYQFKNVHAEQGLMLSAFSAQKPTLRIIQHRRKRPRFTALLGVVSRGAGGYSMINRAVSWLFSMAKYFEIKLSRAKLGQNAKSLVKVFRIQYEFYSPEIE